MVQMRFDLSRARDSYQPTASGQNTCCFHRLSSIAMTTCSKYLGKLLIFLGARLVAAHWQVSALGYLQVSRWDLDLQHHKVRGFGNIARG